MLSLDEKLLEKYRKMINLSELDTVGNNTNIKSNLVISNLTILTDAFFNNNIIINADIKTSNNIIVKDSIIHNITNNLTYSKVITSNSIINTDNIYVNNNLNTNNYNSNNSITILSNLNNVNMTCNNIICNVITSFSPISINSNNINFICNGINFNGIINKLSFNNINIYDKKILLNNDFINNTGLDVGNDSGFNIYGNNIGFIKTNTNNTSFILKPPNGTVNNLLTTDKLFNLNISGNTNILGKLSLYKNINCDNINIFNNCTINSFLYSGTVNTSIGLFGNSLFVENNTDLITAKTNNLVVNNDSVFQDTLYMTSTNIMNTILCDNNIFSTSLSTINNDLKVKTNFTNVNAFIMNDINNTSMVTYNINGKNMKTNNITIMTLLNSNNVNCNNIIITNNSIVKNDYYTNNFNNTSNTTSNTLIFYGTVVINQISEYYINSEAQTNLAVSTFYKRGNVLHVTL